jgi:hypothetical protein
MTLKEARQLVLDRSAPYTSQVEAAALIAASKQSELSDLIRCLRLGGHPAEIAATALYTRTGRPYSGRIAEFSADPVEWSSYLAKQLEASSA